MSDITKYKKYNFANNNSSEISKIFKEFPEKLPNLYQLYFHNSTVANFEEISTKLPNLRYIRFDECTIRDFCGLSKKLKITAFHCTIDSFEGIPENCSFRLNDCTIRSLEGVSRATLQTILVAILSVDYDKYDKYTLPSKKKKDSHPQVRCTLDIPTPALKLFNDSINHEIERRYSPKYQKDWPWFQTNDLPRIPDYFEEDWQLYENEYESQATLAQQIASLENSKEEWIYGFNLMERLFIPENLDRLHEYYRKTTRQLAQDYITNPEIMPPEQIERLVHEVDPELRKMLENNLPPSDPVIKQISANFSFKTENGLKILK